MNKSGLLIPVGLNVDFDEAGVCHWRVGINLPPRIRRFSRLIDEALHSKKTDWGLLAISLIVFDAIRPSALRTIDRQGTEPYLCLGALQLEWQDFQPPRIERRQLSGITMLRWRSLLNGSDSMVAPCGLHDELAGFLKASEGYRTLADPVAELERDAVGWWYQHLPNPLFAHASGLQVLSALSRSTLVRLESRMVPTASAATQVQNSFAEADLGCTAELLDAADAASGDDENPLVLQAAIASMNFNANELDYLVRRRWAQNLLSLRGRALRAGPPTALVLAWGAHLCECGTVSEPSPAKSTVRQYFSRAALPIFELLKQLPKTFDAPEWQAIEIRDRYLGLMQAQSPGNQKTIASALASFHAFLIESFDVEPLHRSIHQDVALGSVRANIIWQHEADLVQTWIERVEDLRVRSAAQILLGIARECPARTNELMRLRLGNFLEGQSEMGPIMEIEITPSAKFGRLKTPAAQRRLTLVNRCTIARINEWIDQRKREGAASGALLFGDPNDDGRVYRFGATTSLLNRMLKHATGDSESSIHTLRHSVITEQLDMQLRSSNIKDPSRHLGTAVAAGHATAMTTFTQYLHCYEPSLRLWLDLALEESVKLSSQQGAAILGANSATLRQQAKRRGQTLSDHIWHRTRQMPASSPFECADAPFALCHPQVPELTAAVKSELTVSLVLQCLFDHLDSIPAAVLASRFGISEDVLSESIASTLDFCFAVASKSRPRTFDHQDDRPRSLQEALLTAQIDIKRAEQPKYLRLREWLSAPQPFVQLSRAVASWKACQQSGLTAVNKQGGPFELYKLLQAARVDPIDLRICVQTAGHACRPSDAQESVLYNQVSSDFRTIFGISPRCSFVRGRLGRPPAYLLWDDPQHREIPKSASSSTSGLDAWMVAIAAAMRLEGGGR